MKITKEHYREFKKRYKSYNEIYLRRLYDRRRYVNNTQDEIEDSDSEETIKN